MDNKTFASSVTKFFYYANNWDHKLITWKNHAGETRQEWLPGFFTVFPAYMVQHLYEKFDASYEKVGARCALFDFFAELDGSYRADVLKYINEHYDYKEGFGIDLSRL